MIHGFSCILANGLFFFPSSFIRGLREPKNFVPKNLFVCGQMAEIFINVWTRPKILSNLSLVLYTKNNTTQDCCHLQVSILRFLNSLFFLL